MREKNTVAASSCWRRDCPHGCCEARVANVAVAELAFTYRFDLTGLIKRCALDIGDTVDQTRNDRRGEDHGTIN
jgi:hypothetical protein